VLVYKENNTLLSKFTSSMLFYGDLNWLSNPSKIQ